jgi:hypothetical protein
MLYKSAGLAEVSAYRFHDDDMLLFTDGMRSEPRGVILSMTSLPRLYIRSIAKCDRMYRRE